MKTIERRINKIETALKPRRYARIEELITLADLKKKGDALTDQDRRIIKEIEAMTLHPDLVKAFADIERRRQKRCTA